MNKTLFGIMALLLIVGGGYYYSTTSQTPLTQDQKNANEAPVAKQKNSVPVMPMAHNEEEGAMQMAMGATPAGTRIIVKNTDLKSGPQKLSFELFGTDGDAWGEKDLKIAHEKIMHFILVSDDFSEYQHLHPEFKDKLWSVDSVLKSNTAYRAYADIESKEDGPEVLRFALRVGTPSATEKVSQNKKEFSQDSVKVLMKAPDTLVAGTENPIEFTVSKNGNTIIPENYLGAKGHVVALGDDPDTYIHGHPSEHADSDVHFAFSFEHPGTYTLFAQFKVDGIVRTFPFTVQVTETSSTGVNKNATSEPNPHGH